MKPASCQIFWIKSKFKDREAVCLLDSGSAENFINEDFASVLEARIHPLVKTWHVTIASGKQLPIEKVCFVDLTLFDVTLSIHFFIFNPWGLSGCPAVIGIPGMQSFEMNLNMRDLLISSFKNLMASVKILRPADRHLMESLPIHCENHVIESFNQSSRGVHAASGHQSFIHPSGSLDVDSSVTTTTTSRDSTAGGTYFRGWDS